MTLHSKSSTCQKLLLALGMVLCISVSSLACNCPTKCNACAGGIISMNLQYVGRLPVQVVGYDRNMVLVEMTLESGDLFNVKGSMPNGKFSDKNFVLYVNGSSEPHAIIDVLCAASFSVNMKVGDFIVVSAESLLGGAICCPSNSKKDNVAPLFDYSPANITINSVQNCEAVVTWDTPEVLDCSEIILTSNFSSGDKFPLGETIVEYVAKDADNNVSYAYFTVTVVDTSAPKIVCPGDLTVEGTDVEGAMVSWVTPAPVDNCTIADLTSTHTVADIFPYGVTSVSYTVRDKAGLSSTCSFLVTVNKKIKGFESTGLYINRIITPDGDGINDFWKIDGIESFPDNKVVVVDRWGSELYAGSGYNNRNVVWHGTRKDHQVVPSGTYYYTLTLFVGGERIEKRGFIEVIK